ncbi:PREDICTED: protein FAM53A [Chrysochloris asiatica]|uniref:Protein FAM53A n=1 Tax=Chrysochloris asiatica TaxID=185453 RepID=A0A9B0U876_CHRAS|nr:PREDICTED: protein FAM53A [Chrysochloris asiatica]
MVTLITEKLQNQSLDDLARKTYDASPYSAEKVNKGRNLFPFDLNVDKSPWKVVSGGRSVRSEAAQGPAFPFPPGPFGSAHTMGLQWRPESPIPSVGLASISDVSLSEHSGQPLAPPTKRHCRSLSEPDELARCRSPWRPGGSKVWTPVSKRRCNSGGSATLQRCSGHGSAGLPRATVPPSHAHPAASSPLPTAPRPASASSSFMDGGEGSISSRRRLSLSQEHITDTASALPSASSTPTATPELSRRQGLLRSRSQPCVLDERKSRRKRRREEDTRWTRPALDLLKMTRTLKNSKSLCSLDYEDEDEDDAHVKTVVSSPCDSYDLVGIITPASSPGREPLGLWTPRRLVAAEGEHPGAPSDGDGDSHDLMSVVTPGSSPGRGCSGPWTPRGLSAAAEGDSAREEGVFPLDCGDLDLEQIENN